MRPGVTHLTSLLLAAAVLAGCGREQSATTQTAPDPTGTEEMTQPAEDTMMADAGSAQGGMTLTANLTGAEEVPGPGDPDGTGTAQITLDESAGEVCFEISAQNIDTATAAHIHEGATGSSGGVVVPLQPPAEGTATGCAQADQAVVQQIAQNPSNYYVNVHNAEFKAGDIRGQLAAQ